MCMILLRLLLLSVVKLQLIVKHIQDKSLPAAPEVIIA